MSMDGSEEKGGGGRASSRAVWGAVLVFVPVVWGYNWVVMKKGLAYAGPFEFAAWRFLLGSALLFGIAVVLKKPLRVRPLGPVIWVGLLQTAGNTGFTMWALLGGPAGRSALLCYTMPFWVVLLGWAQLGERPSRWQAVATALAGAGLSLVFFSSGGARRDAAVLAALSGLCWATGTVLAKRLLTRERLDALTLTAWQMLFGGLALEIAALAVPGRPTLWTPYFCFALFYEVVPATVLAWFLWFALLRRMDAALASLAVLAAPVVGLLSSAAQLGERPAGLEAFGMLLILFALVITGPLALRQVQANQG